MAPTKVLVHAESMSFKVLPETLTLAHLKLSSPEAGVPGTRQSRGCPLKLCIPLGDRLARAQAYQFQAWGFVADLSEQKSWQHRTGWKQPSLQGKAEKALKEDWGFKFVSGTYVGYLNHILYTIQYIFYIMYHILYAINYTSRLRARVALRRPQISSTSDCCHL